MRNPSIPFATALTNKFMVPRRFLWVRPMTFATPPVAATPVGIWTGDYPVAVTVMDGQTGTNTTRTYIGVGSKLKIPPIPRVSDLTIQTLSVKLSQLEPSTSNMVRANNVRFAKVDIHEGLFSTETRLIVANPELVFIGEVDGDPIETPSAGEVGSLTLQIVSDAIRSLTVTNPAKRSYEMQNGRSGDQFSRYSNTVGNIDLTWGEASTK